MTKKSLPVISSSYNDIESLAGLLEDNFQYDSKRNPPYKEEYINHLNLAVGLSLTVIMVRGTFVSTLQSDFNRFFDGFSSSSPSRCNSIKPVALEAARIMYEAGRFFPTFPRSSNCSEFYLVFRRALKETIESGLLDTSKNKKLSERLLTTMLKDIYYR